MKAKTVINWREVLSKPDVPKKYYELAHDWNTCAVGQIDYVEKKKNEEGRPAPVDNELLLLGGEFAGCVLIATQGDAREKYREKALAILDKIEKRANEVRI